MTTRSSAQKPSTSYTTSLAAFAPTAFKTYRPTKEALATWLARSTQAFVEANPTANKYAVAYDLKKYASNVAAITAVDSLQQTPTTDKLGKAKLNTFLHKEFTEWYDAFVSEENEDEDGPSADQRWTLQAAKKLATTTGLPTKQLQAVVGAWLLQRLA